MANEKFAEFMDRLIREQNAEVLRENHGGYPEDAVVVCVPAEDDPGDFTDNKIGACCACGRALIYRPYVPDSVKKACLECAGYMIEAEKAAKN